MKKTAGVLVLLILVSVSVAADSISVKFSSDDILGIQAGLRTRAPQLFGTLRIEFIDSSGPEEDQGKCQTKDFVLKLRNRSKLY